MAQKMLCASLVHGVLVALCLDLWYSPVSAHPSFYQVFLAMYIVFAAGLRALVRAIMAVFTL